MKCRLLLPFILFMQYAVTAQTGNCIGDTTTQPLGIFVSVGDNLWTGTALAIDSKRAIDEALDLFKALGYNRVYWRGLEMGVWIKKNVVRKESVRTYELWKRDWAYNDSSLDRYATDGAHARGMQIWGVGNSGDWASQADAPPGEEYPFNSESRLRIDSPHWVPHDRYGIMRQGGAIEFAYPAARKAMRDIHMQVMQEHNYDACMFLTYAENHSTRFQDEFGYNEPVRQMVTARTGKDFRDSLFVWQRAASRADWTQLRGEYFTSFLKEMKDTLRKVNKKLAIFLDPHDVHYTQPWNVEEIIQTGGPIYQDLEKWVRDSIVDMMSVYGSSNTYLQLHALDKTLSTTERTKTRINAFTSGYAWANHWQPYKDRGMGIINYYYEDEMFLDRNNAIPPQTIAALTHPNKYYRMKILSQLIYSSALRNTVSASAIVPLASDSSMIVRRLALKVLGLKQDTTQLTAIEDGLNDPENGVRTMAAWALRYTWGGVPSMKKILGAAAISNNFSFNEIAITTINLRFSALSRAARQPMKNEFIDALNKDTTNWNIRYIALRVMHNFGTDTNDIPLFSKLLNDTSMAIRYYAATGLASIYVSTKALDTLIKATTHWDPVVANRAATSLGVANERIIRKVNPTGTPDSLVVVSRQDTMKVALARLYSLQGDNSGRIDSAWGYRPVGNALLTLGARGEDTLKTFMAHPTNRRLADHAWKSLYVRQKPGVFTPVTEKESFEAWLKRPRWLDQ